MWLTPKAASRIVQSIPSPKARTIPHLVARLAEGRIEETIDPEMTMSALETYLKKGYTREWINQRLQAIQVRKELTDEWDARVVYKRRGYAILTDEYPVHGRECPPGSIKTLKGRKGEIFVIT